MTERDEFEDNLFGGDSLPPDAYPQPRRKPGRPPGAKNKPKPVAGQAKEPTAWLPAEEGVEVPLTAPPLPSAAAIAPDSNLEQVVAGLREMMELLDFRAFGTKSRILVVILEDVSGSERCYEKEWVEGSRVIPEEIGKIIVARNLIDVAHCTGCESFSLLSVSHGKDFAFPEGPIRYGCGTHAVPWLRGIRALVEGYKAHLAGLGIAVRDVVVLLGSDFCFGDDFRAELAGFKAWAKRERIVTVVSAFFGAVSKPTAAEFASAGELVVDLKHVPLAALIRAVSQSVVRVSQTAPRAGLMADALGKSIHTPPTDRPGN